MFDYHFRIFGAERLKVLTPRTGHGSWLLLLLLFTDLAG